MQPSKGLHNQVVKIVVTYWTYQYLQRFGRVKAKSLKKTQRKRFLSGVLQMAAVSSL